MAYSDDLLAVAKRIFWFGTPQEALEFPNHFLTHAMTYASDEDIEILRKYFSEDDFKATFDIPRPGFSIEAHEPNGMNVTTALPSRRFRRASIPQPPASSFRPSIENIREVY
jgi:hypothetical protein